MDEKEFKIMRESLLKEREQISASKAAARKFLIKVGILTKKGRLRKRFPRCDYPPPSRLPWR